MRTTKFSCLLAGKWESTNKSNVAIYPLYYEPLKLLLKKVN